MMPGRRCFTREPPQILIGKRRPNHTRGRTPHVGGLWPRRVISAPLSLGGARSPVRPRHPAPPPALSVGTSRPPLSSRISKHIQRDKFLYGLERRTQRECCHRKRELWRLCLGFFHSVSP
ncbi:hypothetical protein BHM03_00057544 [Ensete ventricosum]|nr:hypothetical protein BHM03_00057544 [Ensete ventricosum]